MKKQYRNHKDFFRDLEKRYDDKDFKPITEKATIDLELKLDVNVEYNKNDPNELKEFVEAEVEESVKKSLEKIKEPLAEALNQAMQASWGWTEGARDIIDTGELMDSLRIEINGTNISINYDSPYAMLVHYGGYIMPYGNDSIEKVFIPGRPWIDAVLNGGGPVPQFNFEDYVEIE